MRLNNKIIGVLAVATMIVAVGSAGTFAKYTSQEEVTSSSARLAKYHFEQTNTLDLFASSYVDVDRGNVPGATDLSVLAKNGTDKVIAPGTTNTTNITFESDSEVKTETIVCLTGVDVTGDHSGVLLDYITVKNVSINGEAKADATLRAISTAITMSKEVKLGNTTITPAASTETISVPIQWIYQFEGSDSNQDVNDTEAASGNVPAIILKFKGINTQVD